MSLRQDGAIPSGADGPNGDVTERGCDVAPKKQQGPPPQ